MNNFSGLALEADLRIVSGLYQSSGYACHLFVIWLSCCGQRRISILGALLTPQTLFSARTTQAAWKVKPTWYAVSANDRTTSPDLERFLAKRMGARTIELPSSHLSMISHADEIANLILEAAR